MASLVIAVFVCAFTYCLRLLDFAPLRALVLTEDHLYDAIQSPQIHLLKNAHRVVFLDIDDEAVRKWNAPDGERLAAGPLPADAALLPNNTPRKLIAQLVGLVRKADAKVVFLDFDFRNSLPEGDNDLHAELAQAHKPVVLIPTFFTSGRLPPCDNQDDGRPPTELEIVFGDLTRIPKEPPPEGGKPLPSVALVHPVLALGAYGLPEGACSAYRVRFGSETVSREAAMARAVELAIADSACKPTDQDPCIEAPSLSHPRVLPIRWTIDNRTDHRDDSGTSSDISQPAYVRVSASALVKHQDVRASPNIDMGMLKGAIIVIGTTASWSEDTLPTPFGDMQGALAHVNLALSLQASDGEVPLGKQFSLDIMFAIVAAGVTVLLCWRPIFKTLAPGARLSARQRLSRTFREAGMLVGCGVVYAAGSAALLWWGLRFIAGWRFAFLSFIVGAIVGLMIEVCSAVSDSAREWTEYCLTRRSQRVPKTAPQPERSPDSPPP